MDHARAKFARKGSDLQVVNQVGTDLDLRQGRRRPCTCCCAAATRSTTVGPASKDAVADALWDTISPLLD